MSKLDELLAEGRRAISEMERDANQIEAVSPSWTEVLFRRQSAQAEELLKKYSSEGLKFDLAVTDIYERKIAEAADTGDNASAKKLQALLVRRDAVRTLTERLSASVADLRSQCDSRLTAAINVLIISLTVFLLVVAIVTLYVARITYLDAHDSGAKQIEALGNEITALNKTGEGMTSLVENAKQQNQVMTALAGNAGEQEKTLKAVAADAHSQADYLAREEVALRDQRRRELLQTEAGEIGSLTHEWIALAGDVQSIVADTAEFIAVLQEHDQYPPDNGSVGYYQGLLAREKYTLDEVEGWAHVLQISGKSSGINFMGGDNPGKEFALVRVPQTTMKTASDVILTKLQTTVSEQSKRVDGPDIGTIIAMMEHMARNESTTYPGIYRVYWVMAAAVCHMDHSTSASDQTVLSVAARSFVGSSTDAPAQCPSQAIMAASERKKQEAFEIRCSNLLESWVRLERLYGKEPLRWPDRADFP